MTTYVALAPPEADGRLRSDTDVDRFVLVPDKFSVGAFAFSLIWFIYHRMWVFVLAYLAVTVVLEVVAVQLGGLAPAVMTFLVSLYMGLEGQNLRRWSLERRGWRVIHHVLAHDETEAEARVLKHCFEPRNSPVPSQPTRPAMNPIIPRIGTEQVVGLTLRPETHR